MTYKAETSIYTVANAQIYTHANTFTITHTHICDMARQANSHVYRWNDITETEPIYYAIEWYGMYNIHTIDWILNVSSILFYFEKFFFFF